MKAFALALLLAVAGCAAPPPPSAPQPAPPAATTYVCLLPSEQRMLVAELFFGRAIHGRGPLTEAEWAQFAADTVTPNFPAGFTAFDADGQWQNPASGYVARQRTKVLLVAATRDPALAGRLSAVIDAYKARFHQQSVGLITRDSCASF